MTTNHNSTTGPNSQPTAPVPKRCTRNSAIRMASAIGTTSGAIPGVATLRPSTAEVTVIAGVIIPSPRNSPAPSSPSATSSAARGTRLRRMSAASAMMPPSPRLCARMITPAYLIEAITISAQKMSEVTP